MAGISSIGVLPEDCVSAILSLTTPTDAGKLSLVSSTFRSAAESDVVWSRFLPKNYAEIVAASDISGESPLCSKREAFFRLCSPILIDGGKKRAGDHLELRSTLLELEIRSSIKIRRSCRAQSIELGGNPWKNKNRTAVSNTLYGAYLVVKISEKGYGLDLMPAQVCVHWGMRCRAPKALFGCAARNRATSKWSLCFYGNRRERAIKLFAADLGDNFDSNGIRDLRQRDDGWSEIELGEFFTGEDDEHLTMSFLETKGFQLNLDLLFSYSNSA
ncbi:F-box protein PP2-B15, partial [Cucurbita argyrosperma subsp. sororia]